MAFVKRRASSSQSRSLYPHKLKEQKPRPVHDGKVKSNLVRRRKVDEELKHLQETVDGYVPPSDLTLFTQLPLSERTLKGLKSSHFLNPTPIQSLSIPPALRKQDVLGSAATGSGKTLAFLIPLLERLHLLKWGPLDGLGAVVISPTRELAVQTFTQLRDIGKYHSLSAGLVIGGKSLKEEQERLGRMNILIATPGRLLQHLDSTVGFESAGVKVLVLDEADRLLDLGFLPALRAIVSHFTPSSPTATGRQTLLFSATQTSDLAALAKLSLHEPLYINCNKLGEEGVVPSSLEQYYAVVPLQRKLDALWGFVKSHLKMKGLVFVTSGKQVRFIFETFRRLHPGLPIMHLHGKQKQPTRLSIFQRFSTSKHALLVCTDVAARGLDFPSVDWVIQLDCPDDVDSYIHRVGRTARYQAAGKGLCLLCPSEEEGMTTRWTSKGLDVKKIKIKASRMGDLKQQMQNFAFKDSEVKYLGQRAFISYMRSIHIQKDKTIFNLSDYPAEEYAASMGLPGAPQIKFVDSKQKIRKKGREKVEPMVDTADVKNGIVGSSDEDEEQVVVDEVDSGEAGGEASSDDASGKEAVGADDAELGADQQLDNATRRDCAVRTKYDRMFERKNQSILTPHYSALVADQNIADDQDEDGDVFTLARRDHVLSDEERDSDMLEETVPSARPTMSAEDLSKRKLKAATTKKGMVKNRPAAEKLIFDDEGQARDFYEMGKEAEAGAGTVEERARFFKEERERMRAADKVDREVARERKREKKRKRKEKEKERYNDDAGVAVVGDGSIAESGGEGDSEPQVEVSHRPEKKRAKERDLEDEEALALRLLQG